MVEGLVRGRGRRRLFVALAVGVLAIAAVVACAAVGVARLSVATSEHSRAVAVMNRAVARLDAVQARVAAARRARAHFRQAIRAQRGRLVRLRRESRTGYAEAIHAGEQRGVRAGEREGAREGTADGRLNGKPAAKAGWYYVRVDWNGGLPTIPTDYTLKPGPTHAYWVEDDTAYNRDTVGQ